MNLKSKELEDRIAKHGQEIESLNKTHQEKQQSITNEVAERTIRLGAEHSRKEKTSQQKLLDLESELESEKADGEKLRSEIGALRREREGERLRKCAELDQSLALWRTKSDELQKEKQNLDRILQGLGYATEMKSKGDEFL